MSGFEIFKYIHLLAVIAWMGTAIGLVYLQARLTKAGEMPVLMGVGRQMETMGKSYFGPLSGVTLITGLLMVANSGYSFTEPWVLMGYAGIVVTMGIGIGAIGPTGKKLLEEAGSPQPDFAAIAALGKRMRALTFTNIGILAIVVWAMVTRPGG